MQNSVLSGSATLADTQGLAEASQPEEPVVIKKPKKAPKIRLPKKLFELKNTDKKWHERWTKDRDLLNIPHPFRACLTGPPNSGKSSVVKHLLLRQNPIFERMVVMHADPGSTTEYDDCGAEMIDFIPPISWWSSDGRKTLAVVDDLFIKDLKPDQRQNLDRLTGYVSTHCGISVVICAQDPFNIPASCRRNANLFVFWSQRDLDSVVRVARKTGFSAEQFREWFKLLKEPHSSLWIDMTSNSPAKLRIDGYRLLREV
jgi:hypothetical protein